TRGPCFDPQPIRSTASFGERLSQERTRTTLSGSVKAELQELVCRQSLLHPVQYDPGNFIDRQVAGIQQSGVPGSTQGSDRALRIPPVAILDVLRKGGKANINTLVFQLLITPACALLGTGGK